MFFSLSFALLLWLPLLFGLVLIAATVRLLLVEMPQQRRRLSAMEERLRSLDDRQKAIDTWIASRAGDGPAGFGEIAPDGLPQTPGPAETPAPPPPTEWKSPSATPEARPEPEGRDAPGGGAPPSDLAGEAAPEALEAAQGSDLETIEKKLGTTWAIYLGGAAITLGGIFLVRHAIEAGWLGPLTRVVLGGLLGLFLVAAGQRLRLREVNVAVGAMGGAHVPSVLTAAGTLILFASAYAAHGLYDLIGPTTAFVLLGAIALATLASALVHGPALAGLGLAGAYAAPLLVETATPAPWPVVLYLAIVSIAAFALARIRGWLWLAVTAAVGAAVWSALLTIKGIRTDAWRLPAMVHILAQSAAALAITGIEPHLGKAQEEAHPDPVATAIAAVLAGLTVFAIAALPHDHALLLPFAVTMMALFAAASFLAPPVAGGLVLSSVILGTVLVSWPAAELAARPADFYGNFVQLIRLPDAVGAFMTFAGSAAAALSAVGVVLVWQRPRLPETTAGFIALGATLPLLVALTLAYLRITGFGTAISFSLMGGALALGFAVVAEMFDRRAGREDTAALKMATGVFAAAAIAALAIALVAGLQRGYLTAAFAIAALGTAYVADRKQIAMLRYGVAALAIVVLARVIWDPRIAGDELGSVPILNWLLVGYGVPAVCFALASHLLRRNREDYVSHLTDALAILFSALLGVFQIRHFINDGNPFAPDVGHVEVGLHVTLMFGLSHALAHLGARRASPVLETAQAAASALGLGLAVFGLGLFANPALAREAVGGGVPLSSLVPAYLVPGLLALYIARASAGLRPRHHLVVAATLGLVLVFAYAALETRHAFHGADIHLRHGVTDAESWAHTLVWLALAIAYLAYGLVRASWPARAASGLLLAATTIKVGLFDLAGVTGLWRALSFLCLGGVLIAIGMVYQRLVFRSGGLGPGRGPAPAETTTPD